MRNDNKNREYYYELSRKIRRSVLEMIHRTKSPHVASSLSCVELLVTLYFKILDVSPENPFNPDRDRFILSKGHACAALYVVLKERGFLSDKDLDGFAVNNGILEHHSKMNVEQGIETSSGSLGHGLSLGVGMALAAKNDKRNNTIYVLLSDGDLNEGSTWEAIMFASHHGLDNLVAIVDANKMQALGFTKDVIDLTPLKQRWAAFGWGVRDIGGHDFHEIFEAFNTLPYLKDKPNVIIANTVKGKGVSFMENNLLWHYRAPDDEEFKKAMEELSK